MLLWLLYTYWLLFESKDYWYQQYNSGNCLKYFKFCSAPNVYDILLLIIYITALHLAGKNDNQDIITLLLNQPGIELKEGTFKNCTKLTRFTFPSFATAIKDYTFYGCKSLVQISLPSFVTSINDYAFYGCSSLTQISLPYSLTSIGKYAFYGCSSLEEITLPVSVVYIGNYAFYGCSLQKQQKLIAPLLPSSQDSYLHKLLNLQQPKQLLKFQTPSNLVQAFIQLNEAYKSFKELEEKIHLVSESY